MLIPTPLLGIFTDTWLEYLHYLLSGNFFAFSIYYIWYFSNQLDSVADKLESEVDKQTAKRVTLVKYSLYLEAAAQVLFWVYRPLDVYGSYVEWSLALILVWFWVIIAPFHSTLIDTIEPEKKLN